MCFDGDPADVYRSIMRTARTGHRCYECPRTIVPGERYEYITMLYDGHWLSCHVCAFCHAAARWLVIVCDGYGIGGLSEELAEHWDEDWLYRSHWLGRAMIGVCEGWRRFSEPLPDPMPILVRRGVVLSKDAA